MYSAGWFITCWKESSVSKFRDTDVSLSGNTDCLCSIFEVSLSSQIPPRLPHPRGFASNYHSIGWLGHEFNPSSGSNAPSKVGFGPSGPTQSFWRQGFLKSMNSKIFPTFIPPHQMASSCLNFWTASPKARRALVRFWWLFPAASCYKSKSGQQTHSSGSKFSCKISIPCSSHV